MIDKLTPEQEAYLPVFKQAAIDDLTARRDFNLQVEQVKKLYKYLGYEEPKYIVSHTPSGAIRLAGALEFLEHEGFKNLDKALEALDPSSDEALKVSLSNLGYSSSPAKPKNSILWLNGWERAHSKWLQFGAYIGAKFDKEKFDLFTQTVDNIDGLLCYENLVIVIENPVEIHWQNEKLHNEKGAAVVYSDGMKFYFVEGHEMAEKAILAPSSITLDEIKQEQNMEVKRILIRLYGSTEQEPTGYGKYLTDMNAKVIDVDLKGVSDYSAARSLLEDPLTGDRFLLCTDGSTNRIYVLPVAKTAKTCKEAHEGSVALFDEGLIIAEG